MSRKRSKKENQAQLACGIWLTDVQRSIYATHSGKCAMCTKIEYDRRYDVLLKCGKEFIRTLSREQYILHQHTCYVCEHIEFGDVHTVLEDRIDALNSIEFAKTSQHAKITHLIRAIRDAHDKLICKCDTQPIQEQIEQLEYHYYVMHNHDRFKGAVFNISKIYDEESKSVVYEMLTASLCLQTETRDREQLCYQESQVRPWIAIYGGNNITFINPCKVGFKSKVGKLRQARCETECLLRTFNVENSKIFDAVDVHWATVDEFYKIFGIPVLEWHCFFRCFLLLQEKDYFGKLRNYLSFVPSIVSDCVLGFFHFSTFQLLEAFHFFMKPVCGNQSLMLQQIRDFMIAIW